jgi:hypothetical protein
VLPGPCGTARRTLRGQRTPMGRPLPSDQNMITNTVVNAHKRRFLFQPTILISTIPILTILISTNGGLFQRMVAYFNDSYFNESYFNESYFNDSYFNEPGLISTNRGLFQRFKFFFPCDMFRTSLQGTTTGRPHRPRYEEGS